MKMEDFAQYLTTISFDEALHQVRQLSYERIIANEQTSHTVHSGTSQFQHTKPIKQAVAA